MRKLKKYLSVLLSFLLLLSVVPVHGVLALPSKAAGSPFVLVADDMDETGSVTVRAVAAEAITIWSMDAEVYYDPAAFTLEADPGSPCVPDDYFTANAETAGVIFISGFWFDDYTFEDGEELFSFVLSTAEDFDGSSDVTLGGYVTGADGKTDLDSNIPVTDAASSDSPFILVADEMDENGCVTVCALAAEAITIRSMDAEIYYDAAAFTVEADPGSPCIPDDYFMSNAGTAGEILISGFWFDDYTFEDGEELFSFVLCAAEGFNGISYVTLGGSVTGADGKLVLDSEAVVTDAAFSGAPFVLIADDMDENGDVTVRVVATEGITIWGVDAEVYYDAAAFTVEADPVSPCVPEDYFAANAGTAGEILVSGFWFDDYTFAADEELFSFVLHTADDFAGSSVTLAGSVNGPDGRLTLASDFYVAVPMDIAPIVLVADEMDADGYVRVAAVAAQAFTVYSIDPEIDYDAAHFTVENEPVYNECFYWFFSNLEYAGQILCAGFPEDSYTFEAGEELFAVVLHAVDDDADGSVIALTGTVNSADAKLALSDAIAVSAPYQATPFELVADGPDENGNVFVRAIAAEEVTIWGVDAEIYYDAAAFTVAEDPVSACMPEDYFAVNTENAGEILISGFWFDDYTFTAGEELFSFVLCTAEDFANGSSVTLAGTVSGAAGKQTLASEVYVAAPLAPAPFILEADEQDENGNVTVHAIASEPVTIWSMDAEIYYDAVAFTVAEDPVSACIPEDYFMANAETAGEILISGFWFDDYTFAAGEELFSFVLHVSENFGGASSVLLTGTVSGAAGKQALDSMIMVSAPMDIAPFVLSADEMDENGDITVRIIATEEITVTSYTAYVGFDAVGFTVSGDPVFSGEPDMDNVNSEVSGVIGMSVVWMEDFTLEQGDALLYFVLHKADGFSGDTSLTLSGDLYSVMGAMALSDALPLTVSEGTAPVLPGDLDGSGNVTAADARLMLRCVCGLDLLSQTQLVAGDITADGILSAEDARLIRRIAVRLEDPSAFTPVSAETVFVNIFDGEDQTGENGAEITLVQVEPEDEDLKVAVVAKGCSGLTSANIAVAYDPAVLTPADFSSGDNAPDGYTYNLYENPVRYTAYYQNALAETDDQILAYLAFDFVEGAALPTGTDLILSVKETAGVKAGGDTLTVSFGHTHVPGPAYETIAEATCTEPGYHETIIYCQSCGIELSHEKVVIPAAGHALTKTAAAAATCTAAGNTEYYTCSACRKLFADAAGKTEIASADTVIPAAGHTWGEWTAADPSVHVKECTVCHALGDTEVHTFVYVDLGETHAPRCTVCGYTNTRAVDQHHYVNGVCDVCGAKEAPADPCAAGHTWGEWTAADPSVHVKECTVCHALGDTEVHTFVYVDLGETHAPRCTVCGYTNTRAVDQHHYVNGVCDVCGAKEASADPCAAGHTLAKTAAAAATCTAAGNTEYYTCSVCNKLFADAEGKTEIASADTVIAAKGHAWGEWTVREDGSQIRVCGNDASHTEVMEPEEKAEDKTTGITVAYETNAFSGQITLNVEKVDDTAEPPVNFTAVTSYDITMMLNGTEVQPKTTVTVKIPIPAGYQISNLKLYHVDKTGHVSEVKFLVQDGCVVFAASSFSVYMLVDTTPAPDFMPGDVNGDGKVTAADARLALRRAVGLETYEPGSAKFLACDVTGDGRVTAADARKILRAAVGLEKLSA